MFPEREDCVCGCMLLFALLLLIFFFSSFLVAVVFADACWTGCSNTPELNIANITGCPLIGCNMKRLKIEIPVFPSVTRYILGIDSDKSDAQN